MEIEWGMRNVNHAVIMLMGSCMDGMGKVMFDSF